MISQTVRNLGNIAVAAVIALAVGGCSSQDTRPHAGDSQARPTRHLSVGERAAVVAVRQVGVPYRYGGSSTDGFDCSGLVHYAYSSVGKSIPRTTRNLWRNLQPIAADNLRVGDLLFFDIGGSISHVGLYLGSRRFVHAPSSGREVTVEQLDSRYYRNAFVRGGRPR